MMKNSDMKIMFVIGSLRVGGAESQMVLLIQELVKKGIVCEVFAMQAEGELVVKLNNINVRIHDGCYKSSKSRVFFIWQTFRLIIQLSWLLARGRFNILHAYLPMANFLGGVAARIARIKLVITSRRALGTHQDRSGLWKWFDKTANTCSDIVTVNSKAVWKDVVARDRIDETKLRLIYNGLKIKPFLQVKPQRLAVRKKFYLSEDTVVIVMVANLIPYKGHMDVILALSEVVLKHSNIMVLFAGDDRGIQQDLESEAKELGVLEYVRFLGRCDDVPALLSAVDIGLVASHEEGFCNALLEMMASSLPIVATTVGGNAEALQEGELGLLVPPKDPEQLASSLGVLIRDKKMRERMGERAFNEVQQSYSIEYMLKEYLKLYDC